MPNIEHLRLAEELIKTAGMDISIEELAEKIEAAEIASKGTTEPVVPPPRKLRKNEVWDADSGKIRRIKPGEIVETAPAQAQMNVPFKNPIRTRKAGKHGMEINGVRPNKFDEWNYQETAALDDIEKDKKLWGNNRRVDLGRGSSANTFVKVKCDACGKTNTVFSAFLSPGDNERSYVCDRCLQKKIPRN